MATVKILRGMFRNQKIRNQEFELLKPLTKTAGGALHLTVDGTTLSGLRTARIKVKTSADFIIDGEVPALTKAQAKYVDMVASAAKNEHVEVVAVDEETRRKEVLNRIIGRFNTLEKLTRACKDGQIKSLVVSGGPGVGKTFGVEKVLNDDNDVFAMLSEEFNTKRKNTTTYELVTGEITPIMLYLKLYHNRHANNVLVFDDCDRIFGEVGALNLLKAALDTKKRRTIHWNVDSFQLRKDDGVPSHFDFEASVIFISNTNFKKPNNAKIGDHINALMNRSHFLDLTVHTMEERLLYMEHMVGTNGMLKEFGLSDEVQDQIMKFVVKNATAMDTKPQILSLRSIVKMAELAVAFPSGDEWLTIAAESLCVN